MIQPTHYMLSVSPTNVSGDNPLHASLVGRQGLFSATDPASSLVDYVGGMSDNLTSVRPADAGTSVAGANDPSVTAAQSTVSATPGPFTRVTLGMLWDSLKGIGGDMHTLGVYAVVIVAALGLGYVGFKQLSEG